MNRVSQNVMKAWAGMGSRFLPFADAATPDLPLSRLLRLSLFQVSVGMALVLLIGTLNRVMIVELGVPASIVGTMISLPLIFAPLRAVIGFKSDTHRYLCPHGLEWQENYYDHRRRRENECEPFARYIFLNPYRAGLISLYARWPSWWRWGGRPPIRI